jgi:hypothetical protein
MRRLLCAVVLGLSLGVAPVPAARALDPDTLRQDLTEALEGGFPAYATEAFDFTGIETAPQGEAVRVKILGLALPLPDLGGRLEVGDLAFTLADAGPGRYRVSEVETAAQATLIDDKGAKAALINYRLERLTGIWSAALRNFLDLDMAIGGFEVVVPQENLGFAIAEISAVNRSLERADGLIDMEGQARATGLRMINPDFGSLRVGELYVDYESHGQDLSGVRSFNEAFRALNHEDAPPNEAQIAAILDRLAAINILPQGFIERFRLSELSYVDGAQQPRFELDEVEMNVAAGDLNLPLGYGSLGVRVAGLRADAPRGGAGDPLQALMPRQLGFIGSLERFPSRLFWQVLVRGMALSVAAGQPGASNDTIGDAMEAELQAAINEAGTLFRLDRLEVENAAGRLSGEGALQVDTASPAGAQGRLALRITGLDEMIAAVTSGAQSEQVDPKVQGNMMFLMMLKSMARREAGPDGKPIDRFEVVLTPAGEVLVNGQPFGMAPPQQ